MNMMMMMMTKPNLMHAQMDYTEEVRRPAVDKIGRNAYTCLCFKRTVDGTRCAKGNSPSY